MRNVKVTIAALATLALLFSGCIPGPEPTATLRPDDEYIPVISVTGELVPAKWAALSHKTGGVVAEVLAEPGDEVTTGTPLIRLETTDLEIARQIARQEVAAQQAALDRLLKGVDEPTIARADRENAQQIAQAEIALEIKQGQLEKARTQDPAKEAAQAQVQQTRLQLEQARAQNPAPEVTAAQVELERAKIALEDTQDEYNKALDRPWEDQKIRDAWAKQLEQAQLNYRLAQSRVDSALNAQRSYAIGLEVLSAQLAEAQTRLAQAIEVRDTYTTTLHILDAEVEAAQIQLDYLRAWDNPYRDKATDEEIDQATAHLQQAKWNLAQIEQQIQDAELRAPFAGTVGAVGVRVGELVSPGQILVTIGDLNTLRVETTDLDEIQVARVAVGQEVALTFDAFPDRVFAGQVARVSPMAESGTGGVNYTVVIDMQERDPVLRWGMTAFVDITAN
jgi:multidrug efflux pump subunit AcrA (membrane-fusion protein)